MSNKEIKITEYQLKDCNGNLKTLYQEWQHTPKLSGSIMKKSKGNTAEDVKSSLEVTTQVSNELNALLNNSVLFFQNIGISFVETDEKASKYINTISK